jgi:hypothetical protein
MDVRFHGRWKKGAQNRCAGAFCKQKLRKISPLESPRRLWQPPAMRLLLLLSALFLPFSLLAEDAPAKILKALPQTAAECERGEVTTYDRPELGASVDYKKAGVVITVYLYDLGKKSIAPKLDDPTLQQAFKMAMSDLKQATKLGYYSNLQEVDAGTAKFGEGRETLRARYRLTREKGTDAGQRFVSEIHVWEASDKSSKCG